ncbi:SDR family NAD(P)-dependent oxidoreductase [Actinomadura luteofluorescens]|uniref:SDR family NAD(P)-dependent oxidoreductase n=1 Tax=Actinomadura luteofluorescens TaxID=46163 RepID=UPI00346EB5D9
MKDAGAFAGRTVIVTGGGSGIGRATALRFAEEGADVLVVGRTLGRLRETAAGHPGIRPFTADLARPDGPARVVEHAAEVFGRVDVLVNNAAITRPAPLGEIDAETARQQVATNLLAPLALAQEALPKLRETRGVIVNVSSNPPLRGWPRNSVYGATKVALDFLTRTWAVELGPSGVRVVSIAPGATDTPVLLNAGLTPEEIAERERSGLARIPLGRRARPEEIAWWIVTAAGPDARYVTGAVLRVDGGATVA